MKKRLLLLSLALLHFHAFAQTTVVGNGLIYSNGGVAVGTTVATPTAPTVAVGASPNLVVSPTNLTIAPWGKALNNTVTANVAGAPDGSSTATKITESSTNSYQYIYQAASPVSGSGKCSLSVYAKAAGRTWMAMSISLSGSNYYTWFNLSTGLIGTAAVTLSSFRTVDAGNGWYLFTVTSTACSTVSTVALSPSSGDGVIQYLGDGASGIYLWSPSLVPETYRPISYCTSAFIGTGHTGCSALSTVNNASPLSVGYTNTITPACPSGGRYAKVWRIVGGLSQGALTVTGSQNLTCGATITDNGLVADGTPLPGNTMSAVSASGGFVNIAASGGDDTTALQAAIDSGTGRILVQPGIYSFSGLTLPDGVTLECANPLTTILNYTGSTVAFQRRGAPSMPVNWGGDTTADWLRFSIRDCGITKSGARGATGINLDGTSHSVIEGNIIQNFTVGVGVYGVWGDYYNSVRNNFFWYDDTGIKSDAYMNSSQLMLAENRMWECNVGIDSTSYGAVLLRNDVQFLAGANPVAYYIRGTNNTLIGNWAEQSTLAASGTLRGIVLGQDGNTLIGNFIQWNDDASHVSITYPASIAQTTSLGNHVGGTGSVIKNLLPIVTLPTSCSGLAAGTWWNNSTTVSICP